MRLKRGVTLSKAAPIIRNGIPRPREYTASREAPCHAVADAAASVSIPPSMYVAHVIDAIENMAPVVKERI